MLNNQSTHGDIFLGRAYEEKMYKMLNNQSTHGDIFPGSAYEEKMYKMLNNQSTHGDIFLGTDCVVDKKRKEKNNWDNNIVNLGYYHWVQVNWCTQHGLIVATDPGKLQ